MPRNLDFIFLKLDFSLFLKQLEKICMLCNLLVIHAAGVVFKEIQVSNLHQIILNLYACLLKIKLIFSSL